MEENKSVTDNKETKDLKPHRSGFVAGMLTGACAAIVTIALLVGAVGAFYITFVMHGKSGGTGRISDLKLYEIEDKIDRYYIEDVPESQITESVYRGLVWGLEDRYSEYYTPKEYSDEIIRSTGNYCGIGAILSQHPDTNAVYIVRAYEGSPAEKAGLKGGDEIIDVDGHKAKDEKLDKFVQRVRGENGSSLHMIYSREGEEKTVDITREEINVPTVQHRMLDKKNGIGLITITSFEAATAKDFKAAVKDLKKQGMKAVIYDLRDNTGGLVNQVTEILDEILPGGTVVYMIDKNKKKTTFSSDEKHQLKIPTAVLVSQNTASSAEIFTGALRDYKWGTVIGEKTYGKGVVQGTFPLTDGSALKLTIAKYYTPNGECIDGEGIEPDVKLKYKYKGKEGHTYDYSKDNQVRRAKKILKIELKK